MESPVMRASTGARNRRVGTLPPDPSGAGDAVSDAFVSSVMWIRVSRVKRSLVLFGHSFHGRTAAQTEGGAGEQRDLPTEIRSASIG